MKRPEQILSFKSQASSLRYASLVLIAMILALTMTNTYFSLLAPLPIMVQLFACLIDGVDFCCKALEQLSERLPSDPGDPGAGADQGGASTR